jgi:hypothetical protein
MTALLTPYLIAVALAMHTSIGIAAVSPQQAARLGGPELTPIGAQRAGNEAGTIPAWTGGIDIVGADTAGTQHAPPHADDAPLFTISADNVDEYSEHLSEGQQALLRLYPKSWYLKVYQTRRSASYPKYVYKAIKSNATRAELVVEGLGGVRNADITSPFPIPQQGVEVLWNHILRWRGVHSDRINGQAAVTRGRATYRVVIFQEELASPYAQLGTSELERQHPNISIAFKQKVLAPGFESGLGQLILFPTDYNADQRQSWLYNPNLRRVIRNPVGGFDNPAPSTDGLRLQDEADMFNGPPALFEWKLLGKRELYIPYNSYGLHSGDLAYADILQAGHINPELARYELHRVWVVEGTVRSNSRDRTTLNPNKRGHIYSRRVFYLDEDSWQLSVADNYDKDGKLWRVSEGHMINYYDVPVPWYTLEVFHDLKLQRYLANGLDNRFRAIKFSNTINPNKFSPLALDYYVR